jgi:hypothetical protein
MTAAAKNVITESRPNPISAMEEARIPETIVDRRFDPHPGHAAVLQPKPPAAQAGTAHVSAQRQAICLRCR